MRFEEIEIDDHVLDKIESKHGVTFEEVLEACEFSRRYVRRARGGAYALYGVTVGGRHLTVILVPVGHGGWYVVTARDMVLAERRLYRQARRR